MLISSDFHLVAEHAYTDFRPGKKKSCVLSNETIRVPVSCMRFVAALEPASGLMLDKMNQAYMKMRKTTPDQRHLQKKGLEKFPWFKHMLPNAPRTFQHMTETAPQTLQASTSVHSMNTDKNRDDTAAHTADCAKTLVLTKSD